MFSSLGGALLAPACRAGHVAEGRYGPGARSVGNEADFVGTRKLRRCVAPAAPGRAGDVAHVRRRRRIRGGRAADLEKAGDKGALEQVNTANVIVSAWRRGVDLAGRTFSCEVDPKDLGVVRFAGPEREGGSQASSAYRR